MPIRNTLYLATFFCLSLFIVFSLSNYLRSSLPNSTRPTKFVVIGDSIGFRSPRWPEYLQKTTGINVVNFSQDGLKTEYFVSRVNSILTAQNPSHLLILLGTNDALFGSAQTAITNLQSIIHTALNHGVTPIIGTLPPILISSSANTRATQINDGIRRLSGIRVANVRSAFGSGADSLPDGVHPNEQGASIIYSAFLQAL